MRRRALTPALSQREREQHHAPPPDSLSQREKYHVPLPDSLSLWERAGMRASSLQASTESTR